MAEPISSETRYSGRKRKYSDPIADSDAPSTEPPKSTSPDTRSPDADSVAERRVLDSVSNDTRKRRSATTIKTAKPTKAGADLRAEPRLEPRLEEKTTEQEMDVDLADTRAADDQHPQTAMVSSENHGQRKIGEILVDQGLMKPRHVRRVLRKQQIEPEKFGRLANDLGFVSRTDVKQALAMQKTVVAPSRNTVARPKAKELWCINRKDSKGSEAIRTLRSQLILQNNDAEPKPTAILSTERREGRSFIAANLAVAYAQAGRRTLLVDADLRTPRQHRIFNLPNKAGFSSLLDGDHDSHPVFNVIDDLYVVPSGPVVSNPQELLCREYTGQWLDVAMRYFDVVLIDTPAASMYSDAELIAAWAGRSLIVVRKNTAKSKEVQSLATRVKRNKAEISGFVLNAS